MTTGHIGRRIKDRRNELRLTQTALANLAGVHNSLISQLEKELDTATGTSHVATIAEALKVNAVWLQTGRGKPDLDVAKTYSKETEIVISLMEATDDRGRRKALIAVEDVLEAHQARKNSLSRAQGADEQSEYARRRLETEYARRESQELLPQIIESELAPNDVYSPENSEVRTDKHH